MIALSPRKVALTINLISSSLLQRKKPWRLGQRWPQMRLPPDLQLDCYSRGIGYKHGERGLPRAQKWAHSGRDRHS